MAASIGQRLAHAWNAFRNRDPTLQQTPAVYGYGTTVRQDRTRLRLTSERSVIISVYNRIALDVSAVAIRHVRVDQNGRYLEEVDSGLNKILSVEANIDQTNTSFIQDIVMSMFDEGVIAVVPVDTNLDPELTGGYDILTMRTGRITAWFPDMVRVRLYNDKTGAHEEVNLPKSTVAIVENPLYAVMNEPNSTLKRLIRKLAILDAIDEQSGSGKLDIIIQLPYTVKTAARKQQAEMRRRDIELQLVDSKYGIAYADSTEKITQLNRPAENNLMAQIQYLTSTLYSQLGITEDVFTGKADEATMLNYNNRTIAPILTAIVNEFKRKFLTKTARTQKQTIMYFRDAFGLVPVSELANVADKFTRNEILSSNEVRSLIGFKPADDPRADELRNKNLSASNDQLPNGTTNTEVDDSADDQFMEGD